MKALRRTRRRYARRVLIPVDWERLFLLCPRARAQDRTLINAGFTRRGQVARVRLRDGTVSLMAMWVLNNGDFHETFTMRIKVRHEQ